MGSEKLLRFALPYQNQKREHLVQNQDFHEGSNQNT